MCKFSKTLTDNKHTKIPPPLQMAVSKEAVAEVNYVWFYRTALYINELFIFQLLKVQIFMPLGPSSVRPSGVIWWDKDENIQNLTKIMSALELVIALTVDGYKLNIFKVNFIYSLYLHLSDPPGSFENANLYTNSNTCKLSTV